jgi:hypothetical protein
MLSSKVKQDVATKVQAILQEIDDDELPQGEINFLLHVDGKEGWSWANIRNNANRDTPVHPVLIRNETAG